MSSLKSYRFSIPKLLFSLTTARKPSILILSLFKNLSTDILIRVCLYFPESFQRKLAAWQAHSWLMSIADCHCSRKLDPFRWSFLIQQTQTTLYNVCVAACDWTERLLWLSSREASGFQPRCAASIFSSDNLHLLSRFSTLRRMQLEHLVSDSALAFIFTCNFLKMPDCRFQGMKGKEPLFCQFEACTRQIYTCWVLWTEVRDNCCHSFERQQPQMMQRDISGLYTAVRFTKLSSCDTFYQSAAEEREKMWGKWVQLSLLTAHSMLFSRQQESPLPPSLPRSFLCVGRLHHWTQLTTANITVAKSSVRRVWVRRTGAVLTVPGGGYLKNLDLDVAIHMAPQHGSFTIKPWTDWREDFEAIRMTASRSLRQISKCTNSHCRSEQMATQLCGYVHVKVTLVQQTPTP